MKAVTVLLTGMGAPGAPGVIKCLRKNGEREIRIVGVDMNENAGARSMADAFYIVPAAKDDNFINNVLEICIKEHVEIVMPIVTRELMKFARSRERFESNGIRVNVMAANVLETVNNKAHLLSAMRACGLPTPRFEVVHSLDELIAACAILGYPERAVCVKAAVGNGSRGVRMIDAKVSRYDLFFNSKPNSMYISYDELIRTLSERAELPEMLVMELLPGREYSVDFLADAGKPLYVVSRRGISVVTSNMMALVVDNNREVIELCSATAAALEMDGNFGFDLRYGVDGRPYVIEVNPRLTGGVVACAAAGVNLPYLGVKHLLSEKLPELEPVYGTRMSRHYEESFFTSDGHVIDW
jgi:biotin carboxylase